MHFGSSHDRWKIPLSKGTVEESVMLVRILPPLANISGGGGGGGGGRISPPPLNAYWWHINIRTRVIDLQNYDHITLPVMTHMVSQIISNWIFCLTIVTTNNIKQIKALHDLSVLREIRRCPVDSPHTHNELNSYTVDGWCVHHIFYNY